MDMIKMAGRDSTDHTLQRTVIKLSLAAGEAEEFEMSRTGWVDWREIFHSWMMTNISLEKFRPEVDQFVVEAEKEVTCVKISGGYIVMGLSSGERWELSLPLKSEEYIVR